MIIIIFGLPGTGKSYFGERLAEHLGVEYINTDILRQQLQLQGKYGPEEKQLVYELMLHKTEEVVREKKDVILDATFSNHYHLQQVKDIAKQYTTHLKLIEMTADEKVIRKRVNQSRKYSEADEKVYEKIKEKYQTVQEAHLVLDTTYTTADQLIQQTKAYLDHD